MGDIVKIDGEYLVTCSVCGGQTFHLHSTKPGYGRAEMIMAECSECGETIVFKKEPTGR